MAWCNIALEQRRQIRVHVKIQTKWWLFGPPGVSRHGEKSRLRHHAGTCIVSTREIVRKLSVNSVQDSHTRAESQLRFSLIRRVSTTLRQVVIKFSEFFMHWVFHKEISRQDRLGTTIANSVDPQYPDFCFPQTHFAFPK